MRALLLATRDTVQTMLGFTTGNVITGATNASPIVITSVAHGLSDGQAVYIQSVGGNTAANGRFTINVLTVDTFELNGSTGNAAYTTGGTWENATRHSVCDVTIDGEPKPDSGQIFYGIVGRGFRNASQESRDDLHSVEIIITLRAGEFPVDRIGGSLIAAAKSGNNTGGLWARVEELAAYLHMRYSVLDLVGGSYGAGNWTGGQSYSLATSVNGFVQPLSFSGAEYLGEKGPEWFWAHLPKTDYPDDTPSGLAAKLSFDFARRVQTIESQS